MARFDGTRLRLARMRRRMTQRQLGEIVGVDPRTIKYHESDENEREPTPAVADAIAKALGFPVAFFTGEPVPIPDGTTAYFRAATRMSAADRDAALAAGAIAEMFSGWIDAQFTLPEVDLAEPEDSSPEAAAVAVRAAWGLGDNPIGNMVHLLELHGVRIFSLVDGADAVDAFSWWHEGVPYVFLNNTKSAERCRFDLAHELAHMVLHKAQAGHSREQENEAHAFAAAFLMPKTAVLRSGPVPLDLPGLNRMKAKWNVALSALVVRLERLSLLSDWHYRTLNIEISQRGWNRREPAPACRHETSQVLWKVLRTLAGEGRGLRSAADDLALPVEELQGLVSGLAPSAR